MNRILLSLGVGIIAIPLSYGAFAREEWVSGGGRFRPRSYAISNSDLRRLYGGYELPRVDRMDHVYQRGRASKQCRYAVRALRRKSVVQRSIMSPTSLIARAVEAGVPRRHVEKAVATFLANQDQIPNQRYIAVIDFNRRSNEKRLFTINLATGAVKAYPVAHGSGSDPGRRGLASRFNNLHNKFHSSLGCALAAGRFTGGKGPSLMLHGFEPSNDQICGREIIMHGAWYVGGMPGLSHGCPAVRPHERAELFNALDGGGLICSYKDNRRYYAR